MRVLHLNATDILGGAARAAYRIHKGLLGHGVKSEMLVQRKESNDPTICTPYKSNVAKVYARLRSKSNSIIKKLQNTSNPILHSSNVLPSGLHQRINKSDAKIVHLHWINGEMISIKEISKINKPLVWTLHDMWAFSGAEHCHDLNNPLRYRNGYTKNNRPNDYSGFDVDKWTWDRKVKYWEKDDFSFVAPSQWMAKCLTESKLFKEKKADVIPNGLDTTIFKPIAKQTARQILNLPKKSKIVLYGAMDAESNPIKGYNKLTKAKNILAENNDDLFFVIFGSKYKRKIDEPKFTTQYFGNITDNTKLSLIYSAADVMVVPSKIESFGQTASEAMACGTPVVAFNATGPKDIVDHKKNGYLAKPYKAKDLANGIQWILENEDYNGKLGKKARKKAVQQFAIKKVSKQYINLYQEVLT